MALRPGEEAWAALAARLVEHGQGLAEPQDIAFEATGTGVAPGGLPLAFRRNVVLFGKEALHNAVRHGAPSQVTIAWAWAVTALNDR